MKHFTDDQITGYWTGGLKDKEDFLKMLQHMNECSVCRDRTWDCLEGMMAQHKKMKEYMTKMMTGVVSALTGKGMSVEDLLPEVDQAVARAIVRMQEEPNKLEWTSEELFDIENFDQPSHVKRCTNCSKLWAAFKKSIASALASEAVKKDQDTCAAAAMLQTWFDRMDERIQSESSGPEAPSLKGCGGQRAHCE